MKNAAYGKTMETLNNGIDVRLANNKKYFLKWTSKRRYVSQRISGNDLVARC